MGFTKLFSEIVTSTVWQEPHAVRVVWITMLALRSKYDMVEASLPGLAHLAHVTLEECQHAIATLSSPDQYSRSQEAEGRRIETREGGWFIINAEKYRNKLSTDERNEYQRVKQQEYRKRKALPKSFTKESTNLHDLHSHRNRQSNREETTLSRYKLDGALLIHHLNKITGRKFKANGANLEMVMARLKEGATEHELRVMIAKKVNQWEHDEKMCKFLRPKTLFNRTNCAQYLGE